ncbi:MAG TPA: PfkB family carbohydrate kinase [Xanthobacteraceae bacterium]|nr:PfkB family carbohydrate kinase [Xanthobacteraceae bacterium]
MSCAEEGRGGAPARLLCAGIAVEDHVYRLDSFPQPGSKTRAREYVAVGGGCAANAAVAVARLGGAARLAAPLGDGHGADAVGDRILRRLAEEGVDCTACVRVPGARSPISAILVDAQGERLIVNDRDERLSAACIADPGATVAGVDAVLVDNRFAPFVLPLCRAARQRGLPVVLDGDRPTVASDALLTACTHLVFAADGLRATAREDDLETALRCIAPRTDAFLAVTDGAGGVLWLESGQMRRLPAFVVDAVDTLGAGDVFHGAFTLALAEGRGETDALVFASAAAALKCTRFGGIAGAPRRAELETFLDGRTGGNRPPSTVTFPDRPRGRTDCAGACRSDRSGRDRP